MRCMPFAGCKPNWTETPGCLWPQVRDCARFPLLSRAQKPECRLECTNARPLAAKPNRYGAGYSDGVSIVQWAGARRCHRLLETARSKVINNIVNGLFAVS